MGYDRFDPVLPLDSTFGKPLPRSSYKRAYRSSLLGLAFQEVMTLSLSNDPDQFSKMGIPKESITSIMNPKTKDLTNVRISLFPSLFNILRANKHRDLPQRIFEIGDCIENGVNVSKVAGLIEDSKAAAERVIRMVRHGVVVAHTGEEIPLGVDTICVHGDSPGTVEMAETIRRGLEATGIEVMPMGSFL